MKDRDARRGEIVKAKFEERDPTPPHSGTNPPSRRASVVQETSWREDARKASSDVILSTGPREGAPPPSSCVEPPPQNFNPPSAPQASKATTLVATESGEKRYLSDRNAIVLPEGVFPGHFPSEGVIREKPLSAAYMEDLETSLVMSTTRAMNSVQRAEVLVAQLKDATLKPRLGSVADTSVQGMMDSRLGRGSFSRGY